MKALAEAAELLEQSKLVIKVRDLPAGPGRGVGAEPEGHVRGKLVLLP